MIRLSMASLVICIFSINSVFSTGLNPQTPLPITIDGSVITPTSVAGSSEGFLAVWNEDSPNFDVKASFTSDNGTTWSTPVTVGSDSSYSASVACQGTTFIVCWVDTDVGFSTGNAVASISTDQGMTWSMPVTISPAFMDPGGDVNPPVLVTTSSSGYMAAWTANNGMGNVVWAVFSADGISWGTPLQVSPDPTDNPYDYFAVAGYGDTFMIAWPSFDIRPSAYLGQVSVSTNAGMSWSDPMRFPMNDGNGSAAPALIASADGFLVAWQDADSSAHSSFSSDNGNSWSAASLIASSTASDQSNITLGGNSTQAVAAWKGPDNNAYASYSTDHGATWASAIALTSDGSVATNFMDNINQAVRTDDAMFVWTDSDNNGISCYSLLSPGSSGGPRSGGSGCFNQITPNKPGKGLFQ